MNRLSILKNNTKHSEAEKTPFISRLLFKRTDKPYRTDCINLFIQYKAIYEALENRLTLLNARNDEKLKIFTESPWENRSKLLNEDIQEMKNHLSVNEKQYLVADDALFPATISMISSIETADTNKLFAYCSVRCLGDALGGQDLKEYTERTFNKDKLKSKFYQSASGQISSISKHVNNANFSPEDEKSFYKAVDNFFQQHIDLFKAMEQKRPIYLASPKPSTFLRYFMFGMLAVSAYGVGLAIHSGLPQPK